MWLWDEWPGRWGADAGIDLVAEGHDGRLWAIQAKAYDPAYSVTKGDVDTFLSESARSVFGFRLLIATTDRIGKTARTHAPGAGETRKPSLAGRPACFSGHLATIPVGPPACEAPTQTAPTPSAPGHHGRGARVQDGRSRPDDHGVRDRKDAYGALRRSATRCQADARLVPSLSLLTDTLREWTANDEGFEFLPVCSDDTVTGTDAAVSSTADLGFPVTTDPQDIAAFLRRRSGSRAVVFATYQSSPKIAEAYSIGRVPGFDLVVADEAHRCAGRVSSDFATVLDPDAIVARKRLFMTATPRFFTGGVVQEAERGGLRSRIHGRRVPFWPRVPPTRVRRGDRIEELLTDYQVVVVGVDDATYLDWAQRGRFVTIDGTKVTDAAPWLGRSVSRRRCADTTCAEQSPSTHE